MLKIVSLYLLSPLICVLCFFILNISIEVYPLIFGAVIGLVNWKSLKINKILGVILSVIFCYITIYLGYLSFVLLGNIVEGNEGLIVISLMISTTIISPLLLLLFYKTILKITMSRLNYLIIIVGVLFLIIAFNVFYSKAVGVTNSINIYSLWTVIVSLMIQLLLNSNKLASLTKG